MKKSVGKTLSKGSRTPSKRNCKASSSIPPAKSIKKSNPPSKGKKIQKNVEKREWVTVYGFSPRDINLVLRAFEKCGSILEHVTGSAAANWVHILYQKRSDAQIALSKSGMEMNKDVILGVKSLRQYVHPGRIERALNQCLHLLHRSEGDFFVLGETGNVYTVTLSRIPSCNCPDSHSPCKHILFVLLHVLDISSGDDCVCVHSKTLEQCQVARLISTPSSPETLAGARACERFRYLFSSMVGPPQKIQLKIGEKCPYCNDDLNGAHEYDPVVECEECGEVGHESCLVTSRREGDICHCRAHWRAVPDETRYLNLAAYASDGEDDQDHEDGQDADSGKMRMKIRKILGM
ncbi:hypothetical protein MKW92_023820 [Papaver armeniacum]|nr:hypothetical protein MKW92_023820 [Papaver armeniacum]